jgi:hypothetical protein
MSKLNKNQEQFERMLRWFKLFKDINDGQVQDNSSEYYQDRVYAFFINCYHLKDWIIRDDTVILSSRNDIKGKKDIVNKYMKSVYELKICRDICTSSKHLYLTSTPWSGKDPKFVNKRFEINVSSEPKILSVKFTIDTSFGPRDAFDIATKCIEAWKKFYSNNKLM